MKDKTIAEIRDSECDKHGYAMEKKYNQIELANMPSIIMDESFKAGFDSALKAIAQIEFDEKTAYKKQISRDRDYDDFVFGARWQLERIKELCKWKKFKT